MKGLILKYGLREKKKIVSLNNMLFGKITTIKNGGQSIKYYYPGLLEWVKYYKLGNGCYFIIKDIPPSLDYELIEADLNLKEEDLTNARAHWEKQIEEKNIKVRNI